MRWSYCSQTQRFEAMSGTAISVSSASHGPTGGSTAAASITASFGVATCGRS